MTLGELMLAIPLWEIAAIELLKYIDERQEDE